MGRYAKELERRVQTRGPEEGYCVICGRFGKLTRDHVPPKGCNNGGDIVLQLFHQQRGIEPKQPYVVSQGGTNFRTLCGECNSGRLGTRFDPELVKLAAEVNRVVSAAVRSRIVVPPSALAFVRPQMVARAVVGHALAANAVTEARNGLLSSPLSDALRRYFLDESAPMPPELDIYFWVYPSRRQVVIKYAGKASIKRPGQLLQGHILKFQPLGFWLLWDKPKEIKFRLSALVPQKDMRTDELCQMELRFSGLPPLDFPEAPAEDELFLLRHELTSVGIPK